MVQTAKVTKVLPDGRAEVSVRRQSACGHDCSKCGGGCSEMMVSATVAVIADNPVRALPGDSVTVESSTGRILGAAVVVYLVPFLLFFLGYFLGAGRSEGVGAASALPRAWPWRCWPTAACAEAGPSPSASPLSGRRPDVRLCQTPPG